MKHTEESKQDRMEANKLSRQMKSMLNSKWLEKQTVKDINLGEYEIVTINTDEEQAEKKELIQGSKGQATYYPEFFTEEESNTFFSELKNLQWEQRKTKFYGKEYNLPRLTTYYGEPGKDYNYSGINNKAVDWSDNNSLQAIRKRIESLLGCKLTSMLGNYYRGGNDSISWHSDDEKDMECSLIASVSFGGTRRFDIRSKDKTELVKQNLNHGDLILMTGDLQKNYQHQVAKTKVADERINLTFRIVK